MQLFALLTSADQLISQIRRRSASVATTGGPMPAAQPPGTTPAAPQPPRPPVTGRRSGLRVTSVPGVLLTLGALCVLVAGALFLPFAWELLGVVGRTIVLVVLTALAALGARLAGTRGLRATSESLGAVALGLLALDVWGADTSGWFGDISGGGLAVVLGAALTLAGSGATLWIAATPVRGHVVGQAAAVLGSVVATSGVAGLTWGSAGQRLALAVAAVLLVALVSWSLPALGLEDRPTTLRVAAVGYLCVAATAWLMLAATGLVRLEEGLELAVLWPDGAGLDLVLAGVLVAAPALHRAAPHGVRVGLLAVAVVPWTVALTAPAYDEGPTARMTLALAAVVITTVGWLALGPWRVVAAPLGVVAGTGTGLLLAPLGAAALSAAAEAASRLWAGQPGGDVTVVWAEAWWGPAWLLPVGVLVLATAIAAAVRVGSTRARGLLVAGAALLAAAGAVLMVAAPVWVVVVVLVAGTAATVVIGSSDLDELDLVPLLLGAAALYVATYDELLTLVSATGLLVLAVARHLRGAALVAELSGGLVVPLLALATWAGLTLAEPAEVWSALVVLLAGSAVVVGRGLLGPAGGRFGVEVGAVLAALPTLAVGVGSAGFESESRWLALYLTVLGVATTTVALTRSDRRRAAWAGALLLAMASWVRLEDLGVDTVEAYTLPSALALLGVGWWQTHREHTSTLRAWSPGLGLALLPSLLWTLEDPLSWRALLLALACLLLTVGGAQARLAAPLVGGAVVGAALALWEVVPPALEASAWVVSGMAGAILLVLGASWDRRLSEARQVADYVRRLR